MNIKSEIFLNQLAQKIVSSHRGEEWFNKQSSDEQLNILRKLVFFALQAGARGLDIPYAIENTNLKKTYTPCHLLLKAYELEPLGNRLLSAQMTKVLNLPINERHKSFILLLSVFQVADQRKRNQGLNPEKYWWHRDLADEKEVDKIISQYENKSLD